MHWVKISEEPAPTKSAIKRAVAETPDKVFLEDTTLFNQFNGELNELPMGQTISFVGPDPYNRRVFYGTIERTSRGFVVK